MYTVPLRSLRFQTLFFRVQPSTCTSEHIFKMHHRFAISLHSYCTRHSHFLLSALSIGKLSSRLDFNYLPVSWPEHLSGAQSKKQTNRPFLLLQPYSRYMPFGCPLLIRRTITLLRTPCIVSLPPLSTSFSYCNLYSKSRVISLTLSFH